MHPLNSRSPKALQFLFALLLLGGCSDLLPTDPVPIAPGALGSSPALSLNATPAGYIRIGVVQSATTINIGGTGDFTIRDKATSALLATGSNATAQVSLGSSSVSETNWRLQVLCGGEAAVADLVRRAEALGHPTLLEPIAACTRVLLGKFPLSATFTERNNYRNLLISQELAGGDSFWRQITLVTGVTEYHISLAGTTVVSQNPIRLEAHTGLVTIAGRRYRGVADIFTNTSGALVGVNELPLEEYLYGVVPRELGPIAFPEVEAQKAQAVAARTYALRNMSKRIADGYNLRATTDDQVYGGQQDEHPVSNGAVDATRGLVATYNGQLISTYYSSTSGGYTASFEEWLDNASPIPYLTGVPDAERGRALEHVPSLEVFKRHANPTSLRNEAGGDFEAGWAPRYHRWTFEWTAEDIRRVVSAYANQDVGKVLAINVLERGPSGRVLVLEYATEQGNYRVTRNNIRGSLRYIFRRNESDPGTLTNLPSTLFFLEPISNRQDPSAPGFRVYGGGFGHGVGMAQTGAVGMAERGRTYEEILKHYYQGIELEKRW